MELAEIKGNLNRRVRVKTRHTDADYILTGCVIRKNEKGDFFYQAEVQDMKNHRSVLVTGLEDVNPVGDVGTVCRVMGGRECNE